MNKLFSTIMSVCLACNVQATDLFKTSQDIALRAPSVPRRGKIRSAPLRA